MTDIVARLHEIRARMMSENDLIEAADEIERLNRLVDELRTQLKVAEAFNRVAVAERDYERNCVAQLQAELNRGS